MKPLNNSVTNNTSKDEQISIFRTPVNCSLISSLFFHLENFIENSDKIYKEEEIKLPDSNDETQVCKFYHGWGYF